MNQKPYKTIQTKKGYIDFYVDKTKKHKYKAIAYENDKKIKTTNFGGMHDNKKPYEQYKDVIGYYSDQNHNSKKRLDNYYNRFSQKMPEKYSSKWYSHIFLWQNKKFNKKNI